MKARDGTARKHGCAGDQYDDARGYIPERYNELACGAGFDARSCARGGARCFGISDALVAHRPAVAETHAHAARVGAFVRHRTARHRLSGRRPSRDPQAVLARLSFCEPQRHGGYARLRGLVRGPRIVSDADHGAPLRVAAIISNVLFRYLAISNIRPVFFLHAALLPINTWRLFAVCTMAGAQTNAFRHFLRRAGGSASTGVLVHGRAACGVAGSLAARRHRERAACAEFTLGAHALTLQPRQHLVAEIRHLL